MDIELTSDELQHRIGGLIVAAWLQEKRAAIAEAALAASAAPICDELSARRAPPKAGGAA